MFETADHILVIGFGGPTKKEEVQPFLNIVARGRNIPPERVQEVSNHYDAVGGYSRYNEDTFRLVDAIKSQLSGRGVHLPVFVGMRNWDPFLKDTIGEIHAKGLKRGIGVVLAPYRCEVSFERYWRDVEEAKAAAKAPEITYSSLPPWHEHPGFIKAQAEMAQDTLQSLSVKEREKTHLIFSAHSIPVEMAQTSHYVEAFERSSEKVAEALGHTAWHLGYQSRSGSPRQPWLEPDVETVLEKLKRDRINQVAVVPIGFLCENVEVLFDLDIEAKEAAEKLGLSFLRAPTVQAHPAFAGMFAELIAQAAGSMQITVAR